MRIRDVAAGDWPSVWPIISEVIRARETSPYDPGMTPGAARAMWIEPPPGRVGLHLMYPEF